VSTSAPIKVLSNATELIEVLAAEGPQSPADIATRIAVPRSSVYRLIEGLIAISLVETLDDSRVRLTSRWLHLADSARDAMVEWATAGTVLDDLVEATGQTAFLTVRRGDRAVCIDWRQGRGIGVLALKPGRSLPLYAGAAGRVLLAFGDHDAVLDGAPYRALTPRSLINRDDLVDDVDKTLRQGWVLSDEDVTLGISALGMPIINREGTVLGAVSLGGLAAEVTARAPEFLEQIRVAVDRLADATDDPE